jgi:hypothetical protein
VTYAYQGRFGLYTSRIEHDPIALLPEAITQQSLDDYEDKYGTSLISDVTEIGSFNLQRLKGVIFCPDSLNGCERRGICFNERLPYVGGSAGLSQDYRWMEAREVTGKCEERRRIEMRDEAFETIIE